MAPLPSTVHFGVFQVDFRSRELRKRGLRIRLQEQPFQILSLLLERPGEVFTREDLHRRLWPADTFVEFDHSLNTAIKKLRQALGDNPDTPRFVETLPKVGYRFIAPVERDRAEGPRRVEKLDIAESGKRRSNRGVHIALALAVSSSLAAVAYYYALMPRFSSPGSAEKLSRVTSLPGFVRDLALSPDGSRVAFAWDEGNRSKFDIFVKLIGTETPLRLTHSEGPASRTNWETEGRMYPAWSPDGKYLAYIRHERDLSEVYIVPSLGGPERRIYQYHSPYAWWFSKLAWSPDGKWLALNDSQTMGGPYGVFLVSVDSLEARQLTSPPKEYLGDWSFWFSPASDKVEFIRCGNGTEDVDIVSVAGGEPRRLGRLTSNKVWACWSGAAWMPDGREVVFSSALDGPLSLWRLPVTGGAPRRVASSGAGATNPSISGSKLAYLEAIQNDNIWRVPNPRFNGHSGQSSKLISSSVKERQPQYSPDGRKLAFESNRSGTFEIWTADSDGSHPVQITHFGGPHTGTPRWSPDGRQLAFDSRPEGHSDIFVVDTDGGVPHRLTFDKSEEVVPSWSRDGRWIYLASNRTGSWQVWKMPSHGGPAVQVTRQGGFAPFESFDRKFLYYSKDFRGTQIWRMPVGGGEETLVSEQINARWAAWALVPGGIYFVTTETGSVPAIRFFDFETEKVKHVITLLNCPGLEIGFDASPDQKWFVYSQVDQRQSDIMLVEDFR
jgi:Tol biopolymer transport system component/DNA-binding winged helix-turn-helix (wHTH) protein